MKRYGRVRISSDLHQSVKCWVALALYCLFCAHAFAESPFQDCDACPEMVVVPAGQLTVGASEDVIGRAPQMRRRTLIEVAQPFALAKTETTRAQYAAFVSDSGYVPGTSTSEGGPKPGCLYFNGSWDAVAAHDWQNPGFIQHSAEPVLCVSYNDALAYAQWLNEKTGEPYRLPSMVEFEYAAQAGSRGTWYWGNSPRPVCDYANLADQTWLQRYPQREASGCFDGFVHTATVAQFKPNAYGLHDMIGNAWEWIADCWRDSLDDARTDAVAISADDGGDCTYRAVVGGGWASSPRWSRPAMRSKDHIDLRSYYIGFRVAKDLK